MRRKNYSCLQMLMCGLLLFGLLVGGQVNAQAVSDETNYSSDPAFDESNFRAGLANISRDMQTIWKSLTYEPDLPYYNSKYAQAQDIILQIGKLILENDGYIPRKQDNKYSHFVELTQNLKTQLDEIKVPDNIEYYQNLDGVAVIQPYLRDRWLELVSSAGVLPYNALFREGEFLIHELAKIVKNNNNIAPKSGQPDYSEHQGLKALFVQLLDEITYRMTQDENGKWIGLDNLPVDISDRWIELINDPEAESYRDYIAEGERLIIHLGSLIESFQGKVPIQGDPGYTVYQSIINRIDNILDTIMLKFAFSVDGAVIDSTLNEYLNERGELSTGMRAHRQQLLQGGLDLLKERQDDKIFLKYPHRRATIAGLYFRVAELMYQETFDQFLEETDRYIDELNRLSESNSDSVSMLTPPTPNFYRVQMMFQRIVDEFPTSEYADDALYNIGLLKTEEGSQAEKANANRIFETLVSIYPDSDYTLNALRRIAEYYFNPPVNDIEKSIEVYTKISSEFANSAYYQEAQYKLGWAYYRMSDLPKAVEYFALTLDEIYINVGGMGGENSTVLDIASESSNYIGICYSVDLTEWDGAGIENLIGWLNQHPERKDKYGRMLLIQLGDIYRNQIGKFEAAVDCYSRYNDVFVNDPRAPEVQGYVVEIYQQGDIYNIPQALVEKEKYYELFNPDSKWWGSNKDINVRNKVVPSLERYLNLIIDELLVLATDSKNQQVFAKYENYCRQYLRFWPNGPNAYNVQANLATVLKYNLNRPNEALREYWQIATLYEDTTKREQACGEILRVANDLVKKERNGDIYVSPDGEELAPEVAPAVVGESSEIMPEDQPLPETEIAEGDTTAEVEADTLEVSEESPEVAKAEAEEKGDEKELVVIEPLLNSERLFLQGIDLYYNYYPEAEMSPQMLYQAGDILYQHKMFPESRIYLRELIAGFPGHRFVEDAYRLIIEGHFQSHEYAEVENVSKEIASSADLSADLKGAVVRRKAQSLFLNAADLKTENNHFAAAKEFMRVALETPDFEEADKSLFLAGNEFMLDKAWAEANEAFLTLVNNYPRSERADKSLYNVALNDQRELNDIAGAAETFERLVNEYPQSPLVQSALANASANYNQVADYQSAIRINELYFQRYPNAEDADVYLFENAGHFLKLDEVEKANDIYMRFAQKYPSDSRTIQAYFERANYSLRQNDRASASREFRQTVEAHEKVVADGKPGNPKYASKALAQLLEWEHQDYDRLKYLLPASKIASSKERKKQWRNSLFEKYRKLISLGQIEGYKAFYQVGRLDEELALANYDQELPSFKNVESELQDVAKICDESIILNSIAVNTFRESIHNLSSIQTQLVAQQDSMGKQYEDFSLLVLDLQKAEAENVADSLEKQNQMSRILTELDTAVVYTSTWIASCKERIPEIASRNGDYLNRFWRINLGIQSPQRDEEIKLLFREEVLNSALSPIAPEVCGLYLQGLMVAIEFGVAEQYLEKTENGVNDVLSTMLEQYEEQVSKAQLRVDKFTSQYIDMLPKGEDAQSPDGFYPDEMGLIITDQIDYMNNFTLDWTRAFSGIMDTLSQYTTPPEFSIDHSLRLILNWHDSFMQYKSEGEKRRDEYALKYEETDEIQWDDATIAFEDIAAYTSEYDLTLLEEGLRVKNDYSLTGPSGIEIMRTLVEFFPETYAEQFGIAAQRTTISTDLNWQIWHSMDYGFESVDYDDSNWEDVSYSSFPYGTDFTSLDTLSARAIWFRIEKPSLDLPDEAGVSDTLGMDSTEADMEFATDDTTLIDSLQIEAGDENLAEAKPDTTLSMNEEVIADTGMVEQSLPTMSTEERAQIIQDFDEAMARWEVWGAADSNGVRGYLFRHKFDIYTKPSGSTVWITADDNYSLFLNGVYIANDDPDTVDWSQVDEYDVGSYLQIGANVLAVSVDDLNATGYGLLAALIYENIPDIQDQLQLVVLQESDRQDVQVVSRKEAWRTLTGIEEKNVYKPSPDELRRFLLEKKRLF